MMRLLHCACDANPVHRRLIARCLDLRRLGRGIDDQDMPTVRTIVRDSASSNYRFSSLVLGIVKSPAFQMNMKVADSQQRAAR